MSHERFIPRADTSSRASRGGAHSVPGLSSLPADVLRDAGRRVSMAAITIGAVWIVGLLLVYWYVPAVLGEVAEEACPMFTAAAVGGLVCSAGLFALARWSRLAPVKLLKIALIYQILMCFGIGISNYWPGTQELDAIELAREAGIPVETIVLTPGYDQATPALLDLARSQGVDPATLAPPRHLHLQGMGVSWVVVVMLFFAVIVPAGRGLTATAATLSALMDPAAFWLTGTVGVPGASASHLILHFSGNLIAIGLAVVASQVVSGLGRKVERARRMGSYELVELLGRGGMGEVWRARHRMLARPAAIKLIRPEVLGTTASQAEAMIRRFEREAQATALLSSPHTIELYDFGTTDQGVFYYVMELLAGVDLDTLIRSHGPLPPERVVYLLEQVCHSLADAHESGLVHRDIKPANIFVSRRGLDHDVAKVLDFGLVKADQPEGAEGVLSTRTDLTSGTPAFMAPETSTGKGPIDARVDLYALGCVGYWLVTGSLVFEAENAVQMMLQHVQAEPVPPSALTELPVPAELERLLLDCLAKDPDQRPASADEVRRRLAAIDLDEPWTSERARRWWERHLPAREPAIATESTPAELLHTQPL